MSLLVLIPFPSTLPWVQFPSEQQQVLVLGVRGWSMQTYLFSEDSSSCFQLAWSAGANRN